MPGVLRLPVLVLTAVLAVLALATPAGAFTRTVLGTDPVGDGPSPGRDITGVRAFWDSEGSFVVTVGFAGPVAAADRAQITANARAATGRKCELESQDLYLLLSGYTGAGSGDDRGFGIGSPGWLSLDVQRVRADDAKTVTLVLDDPRIGTYDLGCVDIRLSADGSAVDAVDPVFFADGLDSDGDSIADGRDACPETAASTEDGCPVVVRPEPAGLAPLPTERYSPPPSRIRMSTRRCIVPALRGAPLATVSTWLRLVDCRLGKVRRLASRAGARGPWVVRTQTNRAGARHLRGHRVGVTVVRRAR